MEVHQCDGIDIVYWFAFRECDTESMEETDGIGPPWDIVIEDDGRDDEQTGYMMYEKAFLANGVSSINEVLYGEIVDIVQTCEDQKESSEMICPQMGFYIWISDAIEACDEERDDEYDISIDPDVVGYVVMSLPIDLH